MLSVDLSNNVIVGELPSASFASNTQLNTIVLSNNQISGAVVDGTFANNTKLVSLNFANNDVTTVESNAFSSNLLEVLDLSGNELESINGGLDFSSVITNKWITLRALNISNNKITRLEANAFAGLTNIEQIFIQKNRVETIEVTSFSGCTKLTEIDLGGNQLETLEIGTFENLPALKVITLVGNVVVADALVVGALGKDKLLVDGKVYGCTLTNAGTKLDCSNGKLLTSGTVPQFRDLPPTITSIDFSNNDLIEFDATSLGCSLCGENINSLTDVGYLNLAGNKLNKVPTVSLPTIVFCHNTTTTLLIIQQLFFANNCFYFYPSILILF